MTPFNIKRIVRNTKYPPAQAAAIGNPTSFIKSKILGSITTPKLDV
jgi:hypothetical protein